MSEDGVSRWVIKSAVLLFVVASRGPTRENAVRKPGTKDQLQSERCR
jgi:hypothetical protein